MRTSARVPAPKARWFLLGALAGAIATALAGCSGRTRYTPPTGPMPPNTVLLSQMMAELSAKPGFTEAVLAQLDKGGKNGPALLTPKLVHTMREMILGKDWEGLNRFPGWTMREINPTVRVAGHIAGKDTEAEGLANPGKGATASVTQPGGAADGPATPSVIPTEGASAVEAPASPTPTQSVSSRPEAQSAAAEGPASRPATDPSARTISTFIDLGDLSLDHSQTVDLNKPSQLPGFSEQGIVSTLGDGVTRGDGPDPAIAPMHSESARLAYVLNRLSLNRLDGVEPFKVSRPWAAVIARRPAEPPAVYKPIMFSSTPEDLIFDLQATGHTVTVADARYFANFGHFHFNGNDVMMPFWVNSRIMVPHTNRPLLVPVTHTEYEWSIRGPRINADVAFYFGIDGKAEFRTMDELNQPWVLGRHAHTYTGADAVEVTRLSGLMALAYMHQHLARPALPFGGYYALGVCQDAVAAIEKKLTGHPTLFPNTADSSLFNDPRDAEVNALIAAIPKDRSGTSPEPARIFGSLPTTDLHAITIPGLADDLIAAQAAWNDGTLQHTHGPRYWIARGLEALGVAIAAFVVYRLRRPSARRTTA